MGGECTTGAEKPVLVDQVQPIGEYARHAASQQVLRLGRIIDRVAQHRHAGGTGRRQRLVAQVAGVAVSGRGRPGRRS